METIFCWKKSTLLGYSYNSPSFCPRVSPDQKADIKFGVWGHECASSLFLHLMYILANMLNAYINKLNSKICSVREAK